MTHADRRLLQAKMQLERTVPTDHHSHPMPVPEEPVGFLGTQHGVFQVLREMGFVLRDLAPGSWRPKFWQAT